MDCDRVFNGFPPATASIQPQLMPELVGWEGLRRRAQTQRGATAIYTIDASFVFFIQSHRDAKYMHACMRVMAPVYFQHFTFCSPQYESNNFKYMQQLQKTDIGWPGKKMFSKACWP